MMALLGPAPRSREEAAARTDRLIQAWGSPGYPRTEAELEDVRERARHAFDRAPPDPGAFARQFAAICYHGDRAALLRAVRAPTLVLHGACDPLIPPAAGRGTAQAIPGAELRIIEGMGHDLPPGLWPVLVEAIAAHARRAAAAPALDAAA
jgi:pimeloyl-ACP methyl ester carboxylesterase